MPLSALTLALSLVGAQTEPPRLRTLLPNGAAILVERTPSASVISVQLWASARLAPETPQTHGHRHLLEHLLALGPSRNTDLMLETEGAMLRAKTLRDAMQFEVLAPKDKLEVAITAMRQLLSPISVTADQIAAEAKLIGMEAEMMPEDERLSAVAWAAAYGNAGLDPNGSPEAIQAATPAGLENLRRRHFAPEGLVLVIAGPVDLDGATRAAREVLKGLIPIAGKPVPTRTRGLPGQAKAMGSGEARAVPVPSFADPETVAALAAALAIGTEHEDAFVTYTPSEQDGLVIVGSNQAGIGATIDAMTREQASSLFPRARALAQAWVSRQLATPSGVGSLRGLLLSQGTAHRPENMLDNVRLLTHARYLAAFDKFRGGRGVHVGAGL